MRLKRDLHLFLMLIVAVAAAGCTKVKPAPTQSLSLSSIGPTLTIKVVTPPAGTAALNLAPAPGAASAAAALPTRSGAEAQAAAAQLAPTPAPAPTATPEPQYRQYKVVWGDTLLDISLRYGVPLDQLMQANGLTNNQIMIGQVLKIPQPTIPAGAQTYTVAYGDSLYSIAQAHGITLAELMAANGLTNGYYLQPGQVLIIPSNGQAASAAPAGQVVSAASVDSPGAKTYIVKPGDTLFGIAILFNVSPYDLAAANSIANANLLQVGQKLVIP